MSRFGPDPLGFFSAVYRETAPWDVGGPQPAMSALLAEHPPQSPVLDVGCGSGDLAIAIAQGSREVVGIDFVAAAIEQARGGAAPRRPSYLLAFAVEFPIPHSPRQVGEAELRARFTPEKGWQIRELRTAQFESRIAPVPALAACIERQRWLGSTQDPET